MRKPSFVKEIGNKQVVHDGYRWREHNKSLERLRLWDVADTQVCGDADSLGRKMKIKDEDSGAFA